MERLGQIEFKELPSFSLQQQGPRHHAHFVSELSQNLRSWQQETAWCLRKERMGMMKDWLTVSVFKEVVGWLGVKMLKVISKDSSFFGLNSNYNFIWLFQNSVIIPLNKMNLFNAQACFPAPELRTTFMRINKLIWRHLPQAMRVKTFYLLFIFSWDCLTACRGGSLNYSYRVSHWDRSRRRGGRRNNNTTLPSLTISYLITISLWVITDWWHLQLAMYFRYAATVSQFHNDACLSSRRWQSVYTLSVTATQTGVTHSVHAAGPRLTEVGRGGPSRARAGVRMLPGGCGPGPGLMRHEPRGDRGQVTRQSVTSGLHRVSTCLCNCVMLQTRPGITQADSMCGCPLLS